MSAPQWLTEFHRQWQAARGGRTGRSVRGFSRSWVSLLSDAGIERAEDQATAQREAEEMGRDGRFVMKRHKFRHYLIERITLPPGHEDWLRGEFGKPSAAALQAAALDGVADFARREHPRFPIEWAGFCESLQEAFSQGRSLRPLLWRDPGTLRRLLTAAFALTSREWETGTPIRAASVEIGLDSKALERHRRSIESTLGRLFGSATELKSLGLVSGDSAVELSGPLCLHFPDGTVQNYAGLTNIIISATDLARCVSATTSAERLLTIENRTTFHQFIAANRDRRTLLATTSFPTPAFRMLLEKLPRGVEHHHFGDTDPAGWHILMKLREAIPSGVAAFRMRWRAGPAGRRPLTSYDRALLPKLLDSPMMKDGRSEILQMSERGDRGDFEQETLGPPQLEGWPFYRD